MNSSRDIVPLHAADISTFCKNLRQQMTAAGVTPMPSHLTLLNLLAKSAGFRNYQALRAHPLVEAAVLAPAPAPPGALPMPRDSNLPRSAQRAITHFDTAGQLMRWPTQYAVQQFALWGLWMRVPAKRDLTEKEVNRYLTNYHRFGDFATLRRELVNARLLWRTPDGRVYRKEMRRPDAEVREFMAIVAAANARP